LSASRSCINDELGRAVPVGETALVDGVFAGMTVGESDVGRSLLMVFSDGLDTASWLPAERVLDSGRRSDVVVYPIATRGARPDFLEELASLTGGRLHEVDRTDDLPQTFRAILDEFRHRYLVTYTPKNVQKDGWHKLEVKVNRSGARVKARPGYQGG
jgi:VWFA-related protein